MTMPIRENAHASGFISLASTNTLIFTESHPSAGLSLLALALLKIGFHYGPNFIENVP